MDGFLTWQKNGGGVRKGEVEELARSRLLTSKVCGRAQLTNIYPRKRLRYNSNRKKSLLSLGGF